MSNAVARSFSALKSACKYNHSINTSCLRNTWSHRRSEGRNYSSSSTVVPMELKEVVQTLNKYAATSLAESWDNVGLLVEPSPHHRVSSMLLTIDLTEAVLEEALEKEVGLILSYHPPIFAPLKRLTQSAWKERLMVKCIENRIAVFSPHTSYDAVAGGVTDWLIEPFVIGASASLPITTSRSKEFSTDGGYRLEVTWPIDLPEVINVADLCLRPGVTKVSHTSLGDSEGTRSILNCTENGLTEAVAIINQMEDVRHSMEIIPLAKPPIPGAGSGRKVAMASPVTLQDAVSMVKKHLDLAHVRLAPAVNRTTDSLIKSVAVCAGSGGSTLRGVKVDLFVTGEMSHHEVLDANQQGTSVILCDHTNTERGFLKVLKNTLDTIFNQKISVCVSRRDKDPLSIV